MSRPLDLIASFTEIVNYKSVQYFILDLIRTGMAARHCEIAHTHAQCELHLPRSDEIIFYASPLVACQVYLVYVHCQILPICIKPFTIH